MAKVDDEIKFVGEKMAYTIQALDERFIICTKRFNLKQTVIYTIVDLKRNVRGTENLIFGFGFETRQECGEALKRLQTEPAKCPIGTSFH
jgi:hypothetical protein